jgi:hypothetical protein
VDADFSAYFIDVRQRKEGFGPRAELSVYRALPDASQPTMMPSTPRVSPREVRVMDENLVEIEKLPRGEIRGLVLKGLETLPCRRTTVTRLN